MFLSRLFNQKIHTGVRRISLATGIRWMGWGLTDALFFVFIFSFAGSYAETGLISSVYSIVFLIVTPLIGVVTNHMRAKTIILTGVLMYPFIGLSYYLAGLWGMVTFVILARLLNGIAYALDSVGRVTYVRRHTPKEHIGSALGYMKSVANFFWVSAMLLSIVLVKYFEIHELFLFVIPTSIIAFFIMWSIPQDELDNSENKWLKYVSPKVYISSIQEFIMWKKGMKIMMFFNFIAFGSYSVVRTFVPIFIFISGDDLTRVIIFMMVFSLPAVFGISLGWLADRSNKIHLAISLLVMGLSIFIFSYTTIFVVQLIMLFLFSLIVEYLVYFVDSFMTKAGDDRHYGSITSIVSEVGELASIAGPILMGFVLDAYGEGTTFAVMGLGIMLSVAIAFILPNERIKIPLHSKVHGSR
jgi:predicted MFS family arabinose efflux permease